MVHTFLLLRVAARFTRVSRAGSYVVRQARTLTIRASFPAATAEQQRSIGVYVRGGRRHHRPHYDTVYCAGRRPGSTTREEGDRASTSGEEAD